MLKSQSVNPNFFGRNDIFRQLRDALQPSRQHNNPDLQSVLRSAVVHEFGGIGKTQIAIQYAYSNIQQYDAIFWVQADTHEKIANSFKEIAIELQLIQATEVSDPVVTRNIVMEWLSSPYKAPSKGNDETPDAEQEMARWLIIFDNADKPELLRDFWPVSGNGSALVTSRDPLTKTYLHSTTGIDLEPFTRDEAALFLHSLTDSNSSCQDDRESSLKLSDRLGGYPLALVHIAAIIRRKDLTLYEMLERYDKESFNSELYSSMELSPHDRYTHTLSTVWGFEELIKGAIQLLDIMAFLDPDTIAEVVVQTDVDNDLKSKFADYQISYEDARTVLTRASLIKRDKAIKQLSLHRAVQEGARKRMGAQRYDGVFGFVIILLLNAWKHDPEEKFTHVNALWDVARLVSQHVVHMKEIFEQHRPSLGPDALFGFARLLQKNGW